MDTRGLRVLILANEDVHHRCYRCAYCASDIEPYELLPTHDYLLGAGGLLAATVIDVLHVGQPMLR